MKTKNYLDNLAKQSKEKKFESEEIPQKKKEENQAYDTDMPDYLDDFLHHSKKTVFIIGSDSNKITSSPKKRLIKKKLKKEYLISENEEKNEKDKKENKNKKILKNNNIIKKKKDIIISNTQIEIDKEAIEKIKIKDLEISQNENCNFGKNINYKGQNNLKAKLEESEYEKKKLIYKTFFHQHKIIFLNKIKQIFKSIFILIKLKDNMNLSAQKIKNVYKNYLFRHNFKANYIIYKIIRIREKKAQKVSNFIKNYLIRKEAKTLLKKAENNNIIYSSINIEQNEILYFKYKHKSGKQENFYFEYSPLLRCFIYFFDKNNNKYFKIIEGNFYGSNSKKLIDKSYETNNKGENIINIPKLFKQAETISERHDRIINRFIKLQRPKKRMTVDEYEESKKKSKDDYNLKKNSKSQKLSKLGETSRSKSFIKIKGESLTKSILKPSRSYVNLKCCEKKIQFGKAKIRKYKSKKE